MNTKKTYSRFRASGQQSLRTGPGIGRRVVSIDLCEVTGTGGTTDGVQMTVQEDSLKACTFCGHGSSKRP